MRYLRLWLQDVYANWDAFLLALFLAVVVWIIAVQQEDPIITREVPEPISVTYVDLEPGLTVLGDPVDKVTVWVRGPKSVVEALDADAFQAQVSLKGLGPDVHTLPIQVRGPQNVTIEKIEPAHAVVHLEQVTTKAIPVRVEVLDSPPLGYMVRTEAITVEPMTVTVTGPESQVRTVEAAVAEVFVQGQRSTLRTEVVLSPRNARDLPVFDVTLEPPTAVITVPVEQQPGYLEVPVVPQTRGQPAEGYRVSSISVDPATVTLRGSPQVLQSLPGYVETEPLDISGATQDIIERLPLRVPENVAVLGSKSVIVTVRITPLEGGKTIVRPLRLQGIPEGMVVNLPIRSVQIILAGPLPKHNNLQPEEVQAILDLSQITGEGVFTLRPQILTPAEVRVEAVIPEEVQVEVRPPTPTPTPTSTPTRTPTPTATPTVSTPEPVPREATPARTPTLTPTP